MSRRRLLILSCVALAVVGGAVAAAVVLLTGDNGNSAAPRGARTALSAAIRHGGYFTGPALTTERSGALPAAAGGGGGVRERLVNEVFSQQAQAYALRAYPSNGITFARAQRARSSFARLPLRLTPSKAPNATSRLALDTIWHSLGPNRATARPYDFTRLPNRQTFVSGRVTALAIGRRCVPGDCRLYLGAAGGGVFRTDDALAAVPVWRSISGGLTSISIGSLALDPRDPTGNTVYAGTGDASANVDSEAGVGVFKTTNGGATWSLLPGSAFARDRGVSGIAIDPRDGKTIWVSTFSSMHGQSSVSGGFAQPPGAPPLGLYRSRDGGRTFTIAFRSPRQDTWAGIKDLALDANDPDAVFISVAGAGVYRRSAKADGDARFHRIFKPLDVTHSGYSFVRFALADLGARTRIYVTDSDPLANPDVRGAPQGNSQVYRLDDASVPATAQLEGHGAGSAWKKLSSNSSAKPGYVAFRYCQSQCDYSNFVASVPGHPNHVWLGGTFDYYGPEYPRDWNNGRSLLRSTDGGVSWNDMTLDTESPPYAMHPDQHTIAFSPNDPGIAFVGSDGGLVRTSGVFVDRRADCATRGLRRSELRLCRQLLRAIPQRIFSLNRNLATLQFQSLSISPADIPLELLGGTQDNGTFAYRQNGGWLNAATGDGGQSVVGKGIAPVHIHSYYGVTLRVNFNGFDPRSWRYIFPPLAASGERASFYIPLISDPATPGILFVGLQHVWRTSQYGGPRKVLDDNCDGIVRLEPTCGQWVKLGKDLTGAAFGTDRSGANRLNFVAAVARAPSDGGTIWAATTPGRVFYATNADGPAAAVDFKRVDVPTTATRKGTPGRFVSGIVVDPADPLHAWISYSGYAAFTPDDQAGHVFEVRVDAATGKATWTNRSYDLDDQPITALARDPKNGDLYAATDFGVLRLPAGATAWTEAAKGLPYVAVYGLTIAPDASTLFAATHGRGIWTLALR